MTMTLAVVLVSVPSERATAEVPTLWVVVNTSLPAGGVAIDLEPAILPPVSMVAAMEKEREAVFAMPSGTGSTYQRDIGQNGSLRQGSRRMVDRRQSPSCGRMHRSIVPNQSQPWQIARLSSSLITLAGNRDVALKRSGVTQR